MQFYVEGGLSATGKLLGKAYPKTATYTNKQFAILMTLNPPKGELRIWCSSEYDPNYGFAGTAWQDFNANAEASDLCKGISGRSNGLMID